MTHGHVITRTDEYKKNIVRSMGMLNTFFVLAWRSGVKPAQSAMSTDRARNLAPPRGPYNLHGPLAVVGRQTGALTASPITCFVSCEVSLESSCTVCPPSTRTYDQVQVGTKLWKSVEDKSQLYLHHIAIIGILPGNSLSRPTIANLTTFIVQNLASAAGQEMSCFIQTRYLSLDLFKLF
jgi:hypothetical protein